MLGVFEMSRCQVFVIAAVLAFVLALPTPSAHADLVIEELRVPMAAAGAEGLEALLVKPIGPGRHPLALVSHGSPRRADERPYLSARGLMAELKEFARRGFVAVSVLRRGYGSSPGGWADSFGLCDHPTYAQAGRHGAEDLRATIAALSRREDVDATKILAVGISAGGFATVALTANPPPGLVAAISFAGGRGSKGPDDVCHDEVLVDAFRAFGRRSRVPMLWVYAQNDHFFNPALARRLLSAFTGAGGHVEFVEVDAFGKEGHLLFTEEGRTLWLPVVDAFLARHGLGQRTPLEPLPQLGAKTR